MSARGRALVLAGLALGLAAAVAAPAQEVSVSFAAGGFFPSSETVRGIYGSGPALSADVWFRLKGPIGFAAGFGRVTDKGLAVAAGGGTASYPLEFRRTTVPVLVFYRIVAGPADLRLGAGLGFHAYRETWTTAGLDFKGRQAAPRFALTASVKIAGRISAFGAAYYESVRTGEGTALDVNVDVGGLQVLGGLSVRIF